MSAHKLVIIYQAVGHVYINQALYSIASLINVYRGKIPSAIKVIVYTNNLHAFDILKPAFKNLGCILLTEEKRKEWAGKHNYLFRFKPKMIEDALHRYHGDVMYLDTDTAFIKKIDPLLEQLKEGDFLLHTKEWPLHHGKAEWGQTVISDTKQIKIKGNEDLIISDDTDMWNAGIVGVSHKNAAVINDVMTVLDKLIEDEPHYLSEQLTWSAVLDTKNTLFEAKEHIYHYWNDKQMMDQHIADLLVKANGETNDFLEMVKPDRVFSVPLVSKIKQQLKKLLALLFKTSK